MTPSMPSSKPSSPRRRNTIITLLVLTLAVTIAIVIALAVVLTRRHDDKVNLQNKAKAAVSVSDGPNGPVCVIEPRSNLDAAYSIVYALETCGRNATGRGTVIFLNQTYTINSVMNTTDLENVDINLQGTLLWDTNIDYWLKHSLPVGYQNQSTAWLFGGNNIRWYGNGYGTLNGNGEAWYVWNNGRSNVPGRPQAIVIKNTTNSVFEGIRFINSQMWTMTVFGSSDVLLQDIYVSSTSPSGAPTLNTDGVDTMFSDNITFRRWSVTNGDDSISPKANSTNILIEDCDFYNGAGIAIGSVGQYPGRYERVANVTARDVRFHNTKHAAYIKTWTGVQKGDPPNGGGGGLGFATNLTFENFTLADSGTGGVFTITQCTAFNNQNGGCDTSEFELSHIALRNWKGTVKNSLVASLQCSAAAPCHNISMAGLGLKMANGTAPKKYLCDNVVDPVGFKCTGNTDGEDHGW